jgi:hypothetical protein
MVWNLYVCCSGFHKSRRTEMESERWRTSCTGIAGYQYISQYATG